MQVICNLRPFRRAANELQADNARLDTALASLLTLRRGITEIADGTARDILLQGLEVRCHSYCRMCDGFITACTAIN